MTSAFDARVVVLALCFGTACASAPTGLSDDDEDDGGFTELLPPATAAEAGSDGTGLLVPMLDAAAAHPDAGPPQPRDAASADARVTTPSALDAATMQPRDAAASDVTRLDASPPSPPVVKPQEPAVDAAAAPTSPVQDAGARDAGLSCPPGIYAGAFAGEVTALLGFVRIDITGLISIEISAASDGEKLPIKNGKLDGKDQDGNPITGLIGGTMNCATRKLEDGKISEGTYKRSDPIFGGPPTTVRFSGTLTGNYSATPPSAQGKWDVQNENGLSAGAGSWSVTLQP